MMGIPFKVAVPSVLGSMVSMIMLLKHGTVTRTMMTLACLPCRGRAESRTETTPNGASSCGGQGLMVWPTTDAMLECRLFARHIGRIFLFFIVVLTIPKAFVMTQSEMFPFSIIKYTRDTVYHICLIFSRVLL